MENTNILENTSILENTNILEIITEKMFEMGAELKNLNEMCPEFTSMSIDTLNGINGVVDVVSINTEKIHNSITIYRYVDGTKTIFKGAELVETL